MFQRNISEIEFLTHNTADDCWVVINGIIYDFSNFNHPGGDDSKSLSPKAAIPNIVPEIKPIASKDGSARFNARHGDNRLDKVAGTKGLIRIGIQGWGKDPPKTPKPRRSKRDLVSKKVEAKNKVPVAKSVKEKTKAAAPTTPKKSPKSSKVPVKKIAEEGAKRKRAALTKKANVSARKRKRDEEEVNQGEEVPSPPAKKPATEKRKRKSNKEVEKHEEDVPASSVKTPAAEKRKTKRAEKKSTSNEVATKTSIKKPSTAEKLATKKPALKKPTAKKSALKKPAAKNTASKKRKTVHWADAVGPESPKKPVRRLTASSQSRSSGIWRR